MSVDRSKWPKIVKHGLMGLTSRAAAWWYSLICFVAGGGCVANKHENSGSCMMVAVWSYLSIRWVDKHGGWQVIPAPSSALHAAAHPAAVLNP